MLEDSVHLTAPARDIEYVAALALGWPVKPDKAEATYEHGLLRIEVPFKDPMEDAVKVAIKAGGPETKTKYSGPRKLDHQLSYCGGPGKGERWQASASSTRRPSRPRWLWPPSKGTRPSTSWPVSMGSTRP